MNKLTTQDFDSTIGTGLHLVDFFAERCGPCKLIAPSLQALSTQYTGRVSFHKVDVDAEPAIAMQQGITAMPTIKLYKNGTEVNMVRGALPPDALAQMVEDFLAQHG